MNIVVSIGGTGALCADVLQRLAAAGMMREDYHLIILDKDTKCGSAGSCDNALLRYQDVCKILGRERDTAIFKADIQRFPWHLDDAISELVGSNDASHATIRQIVASHSDTQELDFLNLTLSREEQNTSLLEGFYGRPALGALVFQAITKTESYQSSEFFHIIDKAIRDGHETIRIFLIGSIFGGTGAAIFPNLARDIRSRYPDAHKIQIGGAPLLPFFKFPDPPAGEEDGQEAPLKNRVRSDDFYRKALIAIEYYERDAGFVKNVAPDRRPGPYVFDALYFMGMHPLVMTSEKYCSGGEGQVHSFHVAELYAALAAVDFFGRDPAESVEGRQIFTPQLSPEGAETISWENLPHAQATKRQMISFARFCAFMIAVFNPYLQQSGNLSSQALMQHFYGKKKGVADYTEDDLRRLQGDVHRITLSCIDFIKFLMELDETCRLFKRGSLTLLLDPRRADSIRDREALNEFAQVEDDDFFLGRSDRELTGDDVLLKLHNDRKLHKLGKSNEIDFSRALVSEIYEFCRLKK